MRIARILLLALSVGALGAWAGGAMAQTGPGASQRDCQTIRACNFTRSGAYRGCISAYSCRVCRFIRTSCTIDGTRKVCQEMRCAWG